jgi:hypothetical protein
VTYTQFEQLLSDTANRHQALEFKVAGERDGGILIVVTNPKGQLGMPLAQSHRFDVPATEPADYLATLDDLIRLVSR